MNAIPRSDVIRNPKFSPTNCGCRMEPVNDAVDNCDLCSEATGSDDGTGWVIVHCPLHAAADDMLGACVEVEHHLDHFTAHDADCLTVDVVAELLDTLRTAIAKASIRIG